MHAASFIGSSFRDYRIVEFIGAGGMGEVYRAVEAAGGRAVAVKVLRREARDASLAARFFEEACVLAGLSHPHIAALEAVGEVGGRPCIVMEYVAGPTLEALLRTRGPLPSGEAVRLFRDVVEAIVYVHGRGVVHRDIKASNVKLAADGSVKLLDFGIARGEFTPQLTAAGAVVGTWQYLAPEQLERGQADERSDVWALGVLLYELVTGRVPFDAPSVGAVCRQIAAARYTSAAAHADVPREVEAVIARCLRRRPADRYQSAAELLADVRRIGAPAQAVAQSSGLRPLSLRVFRDGSRATSRGLVPLLAAIVALVIAGRLHVGSRLSRGADGPSESLPAATSSGVAIDLRVTEGRAEVFINGRRQGVTPLTYRARFGETFELTLRQAGYKERREAITAGSLPRPYTFGMERQAAAGTEEAR